MVKSDGLSTRPERPQGPLTDVERSEFYLREGERLAHMGSWSLRADGVFDYWSPETFAIFDFDSSKGIPTLAQWLAVLHQDNRDLLAKTIEKMFREGVRGDVRYWVDHPKKGKRMMHSTGEPVFAKIRKRLLRRCVRLSFPSAHHERPMRRMEWRASLLQSSRYRFHGLRFLSLAAAFAYRMPARFGNPLAGMMKALGIPNITPELKQKVVDGVLREAGGHSVDQLAQAENEVIIGLLRSRAQASNGAAAKKKVAA